VEDGEVKKDDGRREKEKEGKRENSKDMRKIINFRPPP